MNVNPRQMVAEALRDGRRYLAHFKHFKSTIGRMMTDGEVHYVAPVNSEIRNMVELTGRGWKVYFGENLIVSRLDNFAELLAMGFEPSDAGRELRLTRGQAAAAFRDIKAQLGAQAA